MKNKRIIIFVTALILLVTSIIVLSEDLMSPYVSFSDAKKKPGSYVQIIGKLDKAHPLEQGEKGFSFSIIDDSDTLLRVSHNETKPLNFEHAEQVVALGRFNSKKDMFEADKLLVKCPSKYKKEQ